MNCWHCNTELIWGGDHDIDDVEDMEYDIVTNLTCPKCESYVESTIRSKTNYDFFSLSASLYFAWHLE